MFIINFAENAWASWPIALYISRLLAAVLSLTVHELAHAGAATALGDDSAREDGRLTLDPRRHVEGMSLFMAFFFGLSWGRTTPIRPHRMHVKDGTGAALAIIAGPLATIGLLLLSLAWLNALETGPAYATTGFPTIAEFVTVLVRFNLGLLLINLLPIHPFDLYQLLRLGTARKAGNSWQIGAPTGTYLLIGAFAVLVFIPNPFYYSVLVPELLSVLDVVLGW